MVRVFGLFGPDLLCVSDHCGIRWNRSQRGAGRALCERSLQNPLVSLAERGGGGVGWSEALCERLRWNLRGSLAERSAGFDRGEDGVATSELDTHVGALLTGDETV